MALTTTLPPNRTGAPIRLAPLAPRLVLFGLLFLLAGCLAAPSPHPSIPGPGVVLDAAGRTTTRLVLAKALAGAQVALVGEVHDNPAHHRLQLELAQDMAKAGGPLFIGVEWLDHSMQPVCDRLSNGTITPEQFAREVGWDKHWGYSFEMFKPILALAAKPNVALLALNAPTAVIRKLARQGLAKLSPAERAQLAPALDLADPAYREVIMRAFRAHGMAGPAMGERFFGAQVARDETMAHRLAARFLPWPESKARAIVFAGGGHLTAGQGLPPRIERRLPGVRLITVLPATPGSLAGLAARRPGAPLADFVVITAPAPRRPMLGVLIGPSPRGLLVKRVFPGAPAQRAGIMAGDILTQVDGRPLADAKDIHRALKSAPFKPHTYTLERNGKARSLTITLPRPGQRPGTSPHRE